MFEFLEMQAIGSDKVINGKSYKFVKSLGYGNYLVIEGSQQPAPVLFVQDIEELTKAKEKLCES